MQIVYEQANCSATSKLKFISYSVCYVSLFNRKMRRTNRREENCTKVFSKLCDLVS